MRLSLRLLFLGLLNLLLCQNQHIMQWALCGYGYHMYCTTCVRMYLKKFLHWHVPNGEFPNALHSSSSHLRRAGQGTSHSMLLQGAVGHTPGEDKWTDRNTQIQMYSQPAYGQTHWCLRRNIHMNTTFSQPHTDTGRMKEYKRRQFDGASAHSSHTHLSAALTEEVSFQGWSDILRNIWNTVHSVEADNSRMLHYNTPTHAQLFPTQQYWQQCVCTSEGPSGVVQTTAARLPKQPPYSLCSSSLTVSSEHQPTYLQTLAVHAVECQQVPQSLWVTGTTFQSAATEPVLREHSTIHSNHSHTF